jgi:type VI secretion system protein ImpA
MAEDSVLDIQALLAPLAESGVGEDLREDYSPDSLYQALRDARAYARSEEREHESGTSPSATPKAWAEVRDLGLTVLTQRSKDIEVAVWLAEAMVRTQGLAGLRDAALLLTGLMEAFWEEGYPRPDEDGMEGRGVLLGGLSGDTSDGTLIQPLRQIPLFERPNGEAVTLYLWTLSESAATAAEGKQQQAQNAIPQLDTLRAEARSSTAGLHEVAAAARAAGEAWRGFESMLAIRLAALAPSTRRVAETLERIADVATFLSGGIVAAPGPVEAVQPPSRTIGNAGRAAPVAATDIASREGAIAQLEGIAAFFRATEPHSPLSYTLDEAARRARMSLPELLDEVLPDGAARNVMLTMLGIRTGSLAALPTASTPPAPAAPSEAQNDESGRIVW